jgi:choline dehydrogenase-like flavoprotein
MTTNANRGGVDSPADVLIVGAGPAGAVAAAYLSEKGVKVVCLEQGDWTNPSDYPGDKPEWELIAQKTWNPNPNVRGRDADYPCDTTESDVNPLMFAGVGGSTILYAAHWLRFLPSDFRVRSLDDVADDWPFTYEDLLPYYERIDQVVGTAGVGGDPAYPPGAPPPLPPHPITAIGRTVAAGMNKLGWHWWPAPQAIPTRDYGNLKACVRYGTCMSGCPNGSKASFDLTFWPSALKYGTRLVTGARVKEVTVNGDGLATGAVYVDRNGSEHHQTAGVVILAANGVGTPRLLLLSKSSRFPDGLANSSGMVGKRLMMHPFGSVTGIFDEPFVSWLGPFGQYIQSLEFYETDSSRGFVRGAKWGLMPTGGPLGAAMSPFFGETPELDLNLHANVRERLAHTVLWGIIAEDLPSESNRVVIHESLTDSDGMPAPKIVYRNDDNSRRMVHYHLDRARESLEAAGAKKTFSDAFIRDTGWHLLGTTTMGGDPAASVVDQYGRAHDVPNLYIYGGSTFPTSSGVNPTATISAVTLRSVEHLLKHARLQEVPV